ncbi:MAG: phospholipase D-like domain-containing protein, partial [Bdellovibrionia bacterium]
MKYFKQNLPTQFSTSSNRISRKAILLAFALPMLLLKSSTTFAKTYDWVEMGKGDIRVISNPKLEVEFRLDLIESAKTSIDLVTFDQRMDTQVGLPILNKLEEAAANGRRIRYAISAAMTPVTDPLNKVGRFLDRVSANFPNLEYIFAGGPGMMWKSGWGAMDGIHEKLLIIDGKIGFVTGRGHADIYMNWLDTAFVFKGPLVEQSNIAFDNLWNTLHREQKMEVKEDIPSALLTNPNDAQGENSVTPVLPHFELSDAEKAELTSLIEWRKESASLQKDYRARLLHHDFLDQMRAQGRKPNSISIKERLEFLSDPVVDEVNNLLKSAQSMQYCSLASILNPGFKQCILEALNQPDHPVQLELFTNSKASHTYVSALHLPAGWYAGLQDLDDLLKTGNAKAFGLAEPDSKSPPNPFLWLHRKLILMAGAGKNTVIFGSHNLTYASSAVLDEMIYEIEGSDFYQTMQKLFAESLAS